MSNKKIIIVVFVLCLVFVITFAIIANKNKKEIKNENKVNEVGDQNSSYDENTGLYYVEDKETGEIISASRDEGDLEFYESHPDYNPNPLSPKTKDLNSYLPESPY